MLEKWRAVVCTHVREQSFSRHLFALEPCRCKIFHFLMTWLSVEGSDSLQAKSFPVSHSPYSLQAKCAHVNSGSPPREDSSPQLNALIPGSRLFYSAFASPFWTSNLTLRPLIQISLITFWVPQRSMMLKPSLWALSIVITITLKALDDSYLPISKDSNTPKDVLCGFRMPKL